MWEFGAEYLERFYRGVVEDLVPFVPKPPQPRVVVLGVHEAADLVDDRKRLVPILLQVRDCRH